MRRPARVLMFALLAFLFFAGPSLIRFYTDWLWFGEVGYQQVFLTMIRSQGTLFSLAFIAATIWLIANLNVALNAIGNIRPVFTTREGIQVTLPGGQQLRTLARAVAVLVAAVIGLFVSGQWQEWLMWRFGSSFGVADPILGHD